MNAVPGIIYPTNARDSKKETKKIIQYIRDPSTSSRGIRALKI
jgi:hypothetical protein